MQGVRCVKKKQLLNKKGFMLLETLIVSIFVMTIFAMLYTNLFPLLGEYERYRTYDSVEGTYIAHWARKLVLDGASDSVFTTTNRNGYINISDCNLYTNNEMSDWCTNFKRTNKVSKIYLTSYSTQRFKNYINSSSLFQRDFKDYISYIPTFSRNTTKINSGKYYHVIVEYAKNDVNNYAIMEVKKN